MDSYQKVLAEGVLTEDKVFTYRLLSRTLRVHPSTAKQMLYDFYKTQNDRRPGAVHATYLVHGTMKATAHANGGDGDVDMTNTSPDESAADGIPVLTLSLVPEDQLTDTLAQYEEVSSIHVYSVGPNPVKDMILLADVAQEALRLGPVEGPSSSSILNSGVRRRERNSAPRPAPKTAQQPPSKAAPPPAAKAVPASKSTKQEAKPSFFKSAPSSKPKEAKEESKPTQPSKDADTPASSTAAKKPPAAPKRGGSANSGIMQAFSKAASMPKREKPAAASNPATPSGDDSSMHVMSDDGEDDQDVPQPKARAAGRKTKKQREEELRRMMEEEDEEEDEPEKAPSPEEEPMEEAPAPEPAKEEPAEVVTASEGGRRRGKRRVMRKKQIMDDQGYLVTIQEQGWESFSEDEAPPATKAKTASSAPAAASAKTAPKKSGPKGGQGNIMSFFSKK